MKKFLLIFFVVFLCLIGGFIALFSYSFNAENYRARIVENLSQLTGRKAEIKGEVTLGWRPLPTLVISDLTLSNQDKSENPTMISIPQVRAEIEWLSLLKNPLIIKKVVLEEPVILLERLKRYETNFDFPILFNVANTFENTSFIDGTDSFSLSINEMDIKDGTFIYNNVLANEKFTFQGINGRGKIASLEGPFSFLGTFKIKDQEEISVDLRFGKIEVSQPLPIKLILSNTSSETKIDADGNLLQFQGETADWLELSGIVNSKKSALLFQNLGLENWPKGEINGSFSLKLKSDKTILESTIRMTHGEKILDTAFSFGMRPPFDAEKTSPTNLIPSLTIVNMDYDIWKRFLSDGAALSIINKISGDFQVKLEKIKVNNDFLTQGIIFGATANDGVNISNLTVQLPQNSSLFFKGQWLPKQQKIAGQTDFQTANLNQFLEWLLNKKVEFLSTEAFKNAHLIAEIDYQENNLQSNVTAGVLNESEFSGKINLSLKDKIGIDTQLELKNFNLDKYFSLNFDSLNNLRSALTQSTLDVKAEDLTLAGYLLKKADFNLLIKDQIFQLKDFSAQGNDNTTIKLSANINSESQQIQDLKAQFSVPNLDNFNKATNLSFQFPLWPKTVSIEGNLSYAGDIKKGNLHTQMQLDRTTLKIDGVMENPLLDTQFYDADIFLVEPEVNTFKTIHDLFPDLKGEMKLSLHGDGNFNKFSAKKISAELGQQNLQGVASWDLNQKSVDANLISSFLDLNTFLPKYESLNFENDIPINIDISLDWQANLQLKANQMLYGPKKYASSEIKMTLKNQELFIPNLILHAADNRGTFSANGKIVLKSPMIIDGKLDLEKWPSAAIFASKDFSLNEGFLTGKGQFIASGNSLKAFGKSLRGQGNIRWEKGLLYGIDMNELSSIVEKSQQQHSVKSLNLQIKHALSNGKTILNSLSGSIDIEQGGVVSQELKGLTALGEVYLRKLNWLFIENKMNGLLSFVLNNAKTLPSLDVELKDNILIPATKTFDAALEQEVMALEKRQKETQEKEAFQEIQNKQNEILLKARTILESSEKKIMNLKDKLALQPVPEIQDLMLRVEDTLQEVRSLAVRSDLNAEQLTFLQEKADLLNLQTQEVLHFMEQKEILRQREAIQKLPPLVKTRLDDMIRIYHQNPESTLLAGLIQKSQEEQKKMDKDLKLLSETEDLKTTKDLIEQIKVSFQKIQKAMDYARPFDIGSI